MDDYQCHAKLKSIDISRDRCINGPKRISVYHTCKHWLVNKVNVLIVSDFDNGLYLRLPVVVIMTITIF